MALKINKELTFTNGAKSSETLVFIDISLLQSLNQVTLSYFIDSEAFRNKMLPSTPVNEELVMKSGFTIDIPEKLFWEGKLMSEIHNVAKSQIESVIGEGTVEIVKDPYS